MYPMLEQELRELVSGYSSAHLAFSGMAGGAFLSTGITYLTVPLPQGTHLVFFCATVITGILTAYFGVRAYGDWRKSQNIIRQVRRETIDAVVQPSE